MWSAPKFDEQDVSMALKNTRALAKSIAIVIETRLDGPIRYDKLIEEIELALIIKMLKQSKSIQDCANKLAIKRPRLKMYMTKMGVEKTY